MSCRGASQGISLGVLISDSRSSMYRRFLVLLVMLVVGLLPCVEAGSADAVLRGKSSSGRTEFELKVGDLDGLIRWVRVAIDGKEYVIDDADRWRQTVVRDQKNEIYVMVLETDSRTVRFWMVPGSERVIEQRRGAYRSEFKAILEASDPRDDGRDTPRIVLECRLDWEI